MNRLAELRNETGKSIRQTADELGLKYSTYRSYETEEREMNSEQIRFFADHYGVSTDYLLCRTDDPQKQKKPDDIDEMLEEVRRRPELKFLLSLATKSRTSAVLESSALLQKYQEESEGK